jgi:hypothetical protein
MSAMLPMASAVRCKTRAWRVSSLTVALTSIAVFAAACSGGSGSPGVAGGSPSASSSPSGQKGPLAYSECMRSHGIPNFPDPNNQGGIDFNATGVNAATMQAAQRACGSLRGGGSANGSAPQNLAKELKFAKCMRSHGVTAFPDPNSNGGFSGTGSTSGPGAVNPQSPTFQAAQATCLKQAGLSGSAGSGGSA